MNLKHVLSDIQTDRQLGWRRSLMRFVDNDHPNGTSLPGAGAVHHIITGLMHARQGGTIEFKDPARQMPIPIQRPPYRDHFAKR